MSTNESLLPKANKGKGTPPQMSAAPQTNNLQRVAPSELDQVNMKISHEKKLEMVIYAKERRMSLTELLLAAFDHVKASGSI